MLLVHAEKGIFRDEVGKAMCGAEGPVVPSHEIDSLGCMDCLRLVAKQYKKWFSEAKDSHRNCGYCDAD